MNRLNLLILCLVITTAIPGVRAVSVEDLRIKAITAYQSIEKAEASGGNVADLAKTLDLAVKLVDAGGDSNLNQASVLLDSVLHPLPRSRT